MAKQFKYVIMDNPPTQAQIDATEANTEGALRANVAQTKCVLKYSWPTPAALIGVTEYTHAEILVEMTKPDWNAGIE